jgi:predicted Rossmann fold flavoprotein
MKTNPSDTFDLIAIGGGAAGFFGAIAFAESRPGARTLILERGADVLEKVRISGGGRCNVTHACFVPRELAKHYPRGEKELLGPFNRFAPGDTIAWFESRGVPLKIEDDGRMFPVSDRSQSIVDCLVQSARAAGVEVRTGARVQGFSPGPSTGEWQVDLAGGTILWAKALLITAGSSQAVWDILRGLGHHIEPPVPSLFTFQIKDPRLEGLAGLSVPDGVVSVTGTELRARGPVLVTHWGLSGPGILRLSAWGARTLHERHYRFELRLDWTGAGHPNAVLEELQSYKSVHGKRTVAAHPLFGLPARLWERLVRAAGMAAEARWADISKGALTALAVELADARYPVTGKSTFKEEFVTAGGVSLREVDFKTFQSRIHPGLFLAGEILDVDAITGGFNFQAAWTGAWIAGNAAGQSF